MASIGMAPPNGMCGTTRGRGLVGRRFVSRGGLRGFSSSLVCVSASPCCLEIQVQNSQRPRQHHVCLSSATTMAQTSETTNQLSF